MMMHLVAVVAVVSMTVHTIVNTIVNMIVRVMFKLMNKKEHKPQPQLQEEQLVQVQKLLAVVAFNRKQAAALKANTAHS
jgi:hypothetical protein